MIEREAVRDAEKFLRLLLTKCSGGPDEHHWRLVTCACDRRNAWRRSALERIRCRRCLAFDQLESNEPLARRLVEIAADTLAALRAEGGRSHRGRTDE